MSAPSYPLWNSFAIDRASDRPYQDQIVAFFRSAISSGLLRSGARLPPGRVLAGDLGVARTTVSLAYERLAAEGYILGRSGAGTYVSPNLGPEFLPAAAAHETRRQASKRGTRMENTPVIEAAAPHLPLTPALPALDRFPYELWARLAGRFWRSRPASILGYGNPAGYWPLREAISTYVRAARGILCEPEQVIVVAGSQAGIDTTARVLLDPGDAVLVETPGYGAGRQALAANGARLVGVSVDAHGMNVEEAVAQATDAKLVVVTPSHQYPVGSALSLPRRLQLIAWADEADAWILEDDYDGEFRYAGRPISTLHSLDASGRVIYLGSLSKVLAPGIRLGYLVVPRDLIAAFTAARSACDRHVSIDSQAVASEFISGGHLAAHLRRLRPLYDERRLALLTALRSEASDILEPLDSAAGLHMIAHFRSEVDDRAIVRSANSEGVGATPLSSYCIEAPGQAGLVMGFANTPAEQMRASVLALRRAYFQARSSTTTD